MSNHYNFGILSTLQFQPRQGQLNAVFQMRFLPINLNRKRASGHKVNEYCDTEIAENDGEMINW